MKYISAEYVPNPLGGPPSIKAVGDDGIVYWVPDIHTDVPPFPEFLESEEGKAFLAKGPPPDDTGPPEPEPAA